MTHQVNLDSYHFQEYKRVLERLKDARLNSGLTQIEVAQKLGKGQYFVSRSETGERRIDIIELQAFALIYGKQIQYFLGDIN